MKTFKKVLSVAAVLALVVTAMPAKAKAAATIIDFEDGVIPAGIEMQTMNHDGVTPDGDPSILSVVDFQGSKMLKVDNQNGDTSKVRFCLAELVGAENIDKIGGIEYDLCIEQPSGDVAGWNGGTIGAGNWGAAGGWSNGSQFTLEDYENSVTPVTHFKDMILEGFGFTTEDAHFLFMNWANNGTDNYIDNIQILDKDGNPMEIVSLGAASETAAADDAASTDVPKTGVVGLGIVYGLGAVATGVVALKRRNK